MTGLDHARNDGSLCLFLPLSLYVVPGQRSEPLLVLSQSPKFHPSITCRCAGVIASPGP